MRPGGKRRIIIPPELGPPVSPMMFSIVFIFCLSLGLVCKVVKLPSCVYASFRPGSKEFSYMDGV